MRRKIIRGKSNEGDVVKQYCFITEDKSKGYEKSLIIHRLILTDKYEEYLYTGHRHLRRFKDKDLFVKRFGIKVSSLKLMMEFALEN